ncbi:Bromodomain-containing protein [Hyaloscypha variabilis F]|uniref:Bromodomain-containing protein n=1 Tax=Hyaloscypha variabilis (strain UAMH 11265 / GT02V1 / F) TaxID=1149755 RepID=A0A2J6S3D5_HYAVF|nr:Bromodomain-containing protein [Hyaloscypha variabilis F]
MAVMTSQHSDGVAFDQKITPVPSTDKMALDLEINGTSNRNETNHDTTSPDLTFDKTVEISPPADHEVNGASQNDFAFESNHVAVATSVDGALDSQAINISPGSAQNSSQLPDTNTTTSEAPFSTSPNVTQPDPSSFLISADSAIDSAIDDIAATSSVLPVIEAQESDLRDTSSSLALAQSGEERSTDQPAEEESSDLGLNIHPEENPAEPEIGAAEVNDLVFESAALANEPTLDDPAPPLETETVLSLNPSIPSEPAPEPQAGQEQVMAAEPKTEQNDTEMADAPGHFSQPKVTHEREDDDEMEPSAKRTKTEDEDSASVPQPTQNGDSSAAKVGSSEITPFQNKEIVKILKNGARTHSGKNFRGPVAQLWPSFAEAYNAKILNQIDLASMEKKLRDGGYPTLQAIKDDVQLLYDNALAFNGEGHVIEVAAKEVRAALLAKLENLPAEPTPLPKREKKSKRSTPVPEPNPAVPSGPSSRAAPARRQSRGAHTAPAPVATPAAPTFALDPTTSMPLIRRDSTKNEGGRPKREIHPPKNKDLPYTVRPKSKKHATELRFCKEVLVEVQKPKYYHITTPFMVPVDPVALNIPNYFTVIKKPMDISTVAKKLEEGNYSTAGEFEKDFRQIIWNCLKFNPPGNPVHLMGKQLEELFDGQWARKDEWIAEHSPALASPERTPESEDEESEEEVPEPSMTASQARMRLIEEQSKLIAMMGAKVKEPRLIEMQQQLVDVVQRLVNDEEAVLKTKKVKKPKAPKAVKKAAPVKKAAAPKKGGSQKQKYMGTLEKETISAGLMSLPDDVSGIVLDMIKADQPAVDVGEDGTLELDIDLISTPTLWKIHGLIMQYAPEVEATIKQQMRDRESPRAVSKPAPKKKNKPMSKSEQESKIQQLQKTAAEFERQSSGSQEPVVMPSIIIPL